ncbi:MAG: Spi family protease inhibitor, partial [Bacteroidetes bacterium]|nr:Spi family protease inhibitor [Bacteroidota bacterium]
MSIGLFILTSILLISSLVYATPVNIETAKQVANNWYSERNDKSSNDFKIVESFIETENAENIFYIFNFDKTGFVMVSADDITIPILGYVFEHNYTSENHPPQFDAMLASFREQIVYARENNLSASQEAQDEWERLNVRTENFERNRDFNRLVPLLLTTWNQDFSWNT